MTIAIPKRAVDCTETAADAIPLGSANQVDFASRLPILPPPDGVPRELGRALGSGGVVIMAEADDAEELLCSEAVGMLNCRLILTPVGVF